MTKPKSASKTTAAAQAKETAAQDKATATHAASTSAAAVAAMEERVTKLEAQVKDLLSHPSLLQLLFGNSEPTGPLAEAVQHEPKTDG